MSPRPHSRPTRFLTRERVIDVAAEIAEERGLEALTMRLLADRLGVSAMTPYSHVRSRREVLRILIDRYLATVKVPSRADTSTEDFLRGVFGSLREVLLSHPALSSMAALQHINGVSAHRGAEMVLGALRDAGLTLDEAVGAFAALSAYTIGFVQQEPPIAERVAPSVDFEMGLDRLIHVIAAAAR